MFVQGTTANECFAKCRSIFVFLCLQRYFHFLSLHIRSIPVISPRLFLGNQLHYHLTLVECAAITTTRADPQIKYARHPPFDESILALFCWPAGATECYGVQQFSRSLLKIL